MYDTIIVGGGAAGLSAAIYNGRYGHKTLVIQGDGTEGSTIETWAVENYPGIAKIDGPDLVETLEEQAKKYGAELIFGRVKQITRDSKGIFLVEYDDQHVETKTVIYAAGMCRRQLGLPNEEALTGKGVCYCATCDGPLYRNKIVGVVGGGDSAAKAALILANYSEKVYLLVLEEKLLAQPINIKRLEETEKIEILYQSKVKELLEKDSLLSGIKLDNGKTIDLRGLFIEIGGIPNTNPIKQLNVKLDTRGYIMVDCVLATNVDGLYAAGDITDAFDGFRQIITAAAGGAVASHSAHNYLTKTKK